MINFTATIRHNSISRARVIDCGSVLTIAKIKASKEFGAEQGDYVITIYGHRAGYAPEIYAERKVSAKKWRDR